MDTRIYNDVIRDYEEKRKNAENKSKLFKNEIYKKFPKLLELENELGSITLNAMRKNLNNNKLEKEIENQNLELKIEKVKNKIINELGKNGLSVSDFEPKYECKKCNDTGYIGSKKCSCLKQNLINKVYNQFHTENFETECFNAFDFGYFSDKPNKEKYKTNSSPRENILEIKAISEKFCENIENKNEKNLLFIGNTGLGKTFLSNCIAGRVINNGYTAIYQTAPMLMDMITDYKTSFDKDLSMRQKYNDIFEVDLLIIDDLGTETLTDFKFMELLNIINTRIIKGKKMVISTNLSLQKLYQVYDSRLTSRLIGNFNICRFIGEDVRLIKKRIN